MTSIQLRFWLFVSLTILAAYLPLYGQICNPDMQFTEAGLFPEALPEGVVGEPYEATATAVLPNQLDVGIGILDICKGRIVSTVPDLADYGLSYACNVDDCVIIVDHSTDDTLTYACLVISGTPTQELDSVKVLLEAAIGNVTGTVCDSTGNFPDTLTVSLRINASTSVDGLTTMGYSLSATHLSSNQVQVVMSLPSPQTGRMLVSDMQGRMIYQGTEQVFETGHNRMLLNSDAWPAGMYVVRMVFRDQVPALTQKLLINR